MALMCLVSSCQEEHHATDRNLGNPEVSPTMRTTDVNTMISDSGLLKYIIVSPLWNVYNEAKRPRWTFPKGLHLDQLDERFRPAASIDCDSATYYSRDRLWRLDGNVVMVNRLRDSFLTQQLFWDQNTAQLYSDSFIHIVRQARVIEGYGFISNQDMTQYTVRRPQGIIPVDGTRFGAGGGSGENAQADTTAPQQPVRRPTPTRASRRAPTLEQAATLTPQRATSPSQPPRR